MSDRTGQMVVDRYEAALFDLDGVVYLGPAPVAGAPEGIQQLKEHGTRLGYVTNNAARKPQVVVDQLTALGVPAEISDVVTSAQAGARMLAEELAPGSNVLVVGTQALADEVAAVGMRPVWTSNEEPAAVIQGYDPQMTWPRLDDACLAVQRGARWFATNTDSTRPTDKGLVPGAGAQIAAVQATVKVTPQVAGKPCPPLLLETMRRIGTERAIFVGDRLDTDVMGAVAVQMDSLFVFTGAHGKHDLLSADEDSRPSHIGYDLRALLAPAREAVVDQDSCTVNGQTATWSDDTVTLAAVPAEREQQLDALWAVLQLVWSHPGAAAPVVDELTLLP
ncbi:MULTISPECIES: HAD-IIA family hydrolase [unclassified Luteococcus]|uniref:HAD-IIA family hydrolase n=1 Tax=unclassified Luteococcus TaxID=2639923 RepID=UPI00313B58EA